MVHPGNSMSTSNIPATTCMEKLTPSASAASQDNLVNVESTMMSSSTSRIVSTAYYDESGFKEDSTGKKIKFPIETYQGLEKATAERVRRFVDETRANLMRGRPESSPNLNSGRTTSDAHMDWTDDLAGGILFQDDHSYPGQDIRTTPGQSPYTDRVQAQDRFVNLTYRSPSVIHETTHHPRGHRGQLMGQHQLIHHGHPMSTPIRSAGGLIRGLSLGELSPRSPEVALTPFDFDTKKSCHSWHLETFKTRQITDRHSTLCAKSGTNPGTSWNQRINVNIL